MRLHAFILASGVIACAVGAQAQPSAGPADPLADLQGDFGAIVGEAFHRPDPVINAKGVDSGAGVALRTSIEVPGAIFAGIVKPFADADAATEPAPAVAPAPMRHRHMRMHRHLASRG